jgi:flagellar biosynthesis protein FliR
MIGVSSVQLEQWLALFAFPLARVSGLMLAAPVFNNTGVPRRIRIILTLVLTIALIPALPSLPQFSVASWQGLLVLAEQFLLGTLLGFVLRITFAAVDTAGQLIGLQMGLSFAMFYDPRNAAQTPVLSEFLGLLATLIFLAMNGHLLIIALLAESFTLMPIGTPIAVGSYAAVLAWGTTVFSAGVLLSLPLVAALLIANIAMGVLSRVAPQLNLFAIGFPVTIVAGFTVLMISLPYFGAALERLFDQSFLVLSQLMRVATT